MTKVYDSHFFRLTRSYEESAPIFCAMAENPRVTRIIVYEHPADTDVARTHIHAYVQCTCSRDTIKNQIKKVVGSVAVSDWAFANKKYEKFNDLITVENPVSDLSRMITYMSKGKYQPMMTKGIDDDEVKIATERWVDYKAKATTFHQTIDDVKNVTEKKFDSRYTRMDVVEMIAKDLIEAKADFFNWTHELTDSDKRHLISLYTDKQILDTTLKTLWAVKIIPGAYKYLDYAIAIRMFYNDDKRPSAIYQNHLDKMSSGMHRI